jgi:Flp pilus assembly CpaF family ATPase
VLQRGVEMPYRAIKTNIADSLNVIVQIERRPGRRFVSEVVEIQGYGPNKDHYSLTPNSNGLQRRHFDQIGGAAQARGTVA